MTDEHAAAIAELRTALVAAHGELMRRYIHEPEPALAAENMDRVGVKIAALDALLSDATGMRQQLDSALAAIRSLHAPTNDTRERERLLDAALRAAESRLRSSDAVLYEQSAECRALKAFDRERRGES